MSTEEQTLTLVIGGIFFELKPEIVATFGIMRQDTILKAFHIVGTILKLSSDLEHFHGVPGCAFIVEPTDDSFDGVAYLVNLRISGSSPYVTRLLFLPS